jgi:hypothetical protein
MNPVERYLAELAHLRRAGAGVDELSGYPALKNLLDEIGSTTRPKVRTIMSLRHLGAGLPDGGLFTASQFTRGASSDRSIAKESRGSRLGLGPLGWLAPPSVEPPVSPSARPPVRLPNSGGLVEAVRQPHAVDPDE